jgi:acetyl-CoA synthetase
VASLDASRLAAAGLDDASAHALAGAVHAAAAGLNRTDPGVQDALWDRLRRSQLRPDHPHEVHRVYGWVFSDRDARAPPPAAWTPTEDERRRTNLARWMADRGAADYTAFHAWTVRDQDGFWSDFLRRIDLPFKRAPERALDATAGPDRPRWLPGAVMNIADACFRAPADKTAIIAGGESQAEWQRITYGQLDHLARRVARGLDLLGLAPKARVALYLPMTVESVALYLGIVRSGRTVVGIADASAPADLAKKIRIADARALFTVDAYVRGGKTLPLYPKAVEAEAPPTVVLPGGAASGVPLRAGDRTWSDFLGDDGRYESADRLPEDFTNVLFSSGTTKDPKAIPWTHVTPIKCLLDAYAHHDVQADDVLAWPTSFGWMMGPWLTYASLALGATMALYNGDPRSHGFARFVQDAQVTLLGVVPKLVSHWRENGVLEGTDWSAVRRFSSTGETSHADDMLWLMRQAGYKPIIEYCGGTEIGGGYITGTMTQPASPSTFTTPALGLDFVVLDDAGRPADRGEAFLVPPSIGLSTDLLNYDHHAEYYADAPRGPQGEILRRHGDLLQTVGAGWWRHLGRKRDMINVHGVKTSSEEIRAVLKHPEVADTKPVAIDVDGTGQHRLVVYAVPKEPSRAHAADLRSRLPAEFNRLIKRDLNPLLAHVADVVLVDALPQAGPGKTLTSDWFRQDYLRRAAPAARP